MTTVTTRCKPLLRRSRRPPMRSRASLRSNSTPWHSCSMSCASNGRETSSAPSKGFCKPSFARCCPASWRSVRCMTCVPASFARSNTSSASSRRQSATTMLSIFRLASSDGAAMLRNAHNGRRILVTPIWPLVVAECDNLRVQFAALLHEHQKLLQLLRETQAILREARLEAEQRVAALYRERDLARARAAERDPALPLH